MKKLLCPKCSGEMSFITFSKALTPWLLQCKHCKARLQFKKYRISAMIVALVVSLAIAFPFYLQLIDLRIMIFLLLVGIIVMEVALYGFIRGFEIGLEVRK